MTELFITERSHLGRWLGDCSKNPYLKIFWLIFVILFVWWWQRQKLLSKHLAIGKIFFANNKPSLKIICRELSHRQKLFPWAELLAKIILKVWWPYATLFALIFLFIQYSRYIHTIIHPSFINIRWGPSPLFPACWFIGKKCSACALSLFRIRLANFQNCCDGWVSAKIICGGLSHWQNLFPVDWVISKNYFPWAEFSL